VGFTLGDPPRGSSSITEVACPLLCGWFAAMKCGSAEVGICAGDGNNSSRAPVAWLPLHHVPVTAATNRKRATMEPDAKRKFGASIGLAV
jgi:hypothetical protein